MPQVTVNSTPQRIPAADLPNSGGVDIELQNLGGSPLEYAPRKTLSYGTATGGLRLEVNGTASRARVRDYVYVSCASGQTTTLAYESF